MKSAICLIVKNEFSDISEWVAHHAGIGADRLIIYDNDSTDGTGEKLRQLAQHFPVDVMPWNINAENRQAEAYLDCLKRFGAQYDWIGFLDADEFLIPPPGASLPQLLERHKDRDAFSINWRIFGSSGIADTNGRMVMETFTRRAEIDFEDNHHVKSFVRPGKFVKYLTPHAFIGPESWGDVMGRDIEWGEMPGIVRPGTIPDSDWSLHHYVLRSDAHGLRRMARGAATSRRQSKTQEFFIHHDRNEVADETALPYAAHAREILQSKGFPVPSADQKPISRAMPSILPSFDWTQRPVAGHIRLHIDSLDGLGLRGWAQDDQTDANTPLQLIVLVDGQAQKLVDCTDIRADVEGAGFKAKSGFNIALPSSVLNGTDRSLAIETMDRQRVLIHTKDGATLALDFNDKWSPKFISAVDGFQNGVLRGWVLCADDSGQWAGNAKLAVTCDGDLIGYTHANRRRGDVGRAHAADPDCGFEFAVPPEFRKTHPQKFGVRLTPSDAELQGSPVEHSFPDNDYDGPSAHDDYDRWARHYLKTLRERVEAARDGASATGDRPRISIVCPVYKPDPDAFGQAVESVMQQTYPNWELVLADDGSRSPELAAQMEAYAARDSRIKVIREDENKGIADATNRAVRAATGEWIAFLDHDDVLADVALEVMAKQAKTSGALLLYSDEDKIGDDGRFTDPALKPAWNHRMMLSANYVCHFTMVDRAALAQAGDFSAAHNGAQDHDMLLRLSEILPPEKIRHVPEILYHWRISANSTAGGAEAKPYAIAAGQRAVEDHLRRSGIEAQARSIADRTWYQVDWPFTEEPKACIIIPFKDQIGITRECLKRVIDKTGYDNFEVILVDNGSVTDEAKAFCETAAATPRVRVMRDDGPFNFSRLNNRAARASDADYLVLMNNDLHVRDGDWLRVIVNEALADKDVGIVGGKFMYPDGSVQHAGVVLGAGGVACHINGGIGEHDPGYSGRALFAQELSAVTAACLLVDAKLYWEAGGLDEQNLAVAFNDIDLCLKARERGRKVIWTPAFTATHHESLSRGNDNANPAKQERFRREAEYMQQRWGEVLTRDPFYSRFFDLSVPDAFRDLVHPGRLPGQPMSLTPARATRWVHG